MSQLTLTQLDKVSQRQERRRWLTACCWAVSGILAVGLALVGLDRLLGIADLSGRVILSGAFVTAAFWIFRWWRAEVRGIEVTSLQVAHQVERRYPALRGVLANAWEFASQSEEDPTAGSESLRRAVVLRAVSDLDAVDWESLVSRRPLRRGTLALGCVAIIAGLFGSLLPDAMAIGFTRLVNPLSTAEWPREHNLRFVDPPRLLAAGEDLNLQLEDSSGTLPEDVEVRFRTRRQGRWEEEVQVVTAGGETQLVRRSNVRDSLEFRAVGGDHFTMPWHRLEVRPAPRVKDFTLTIYPPAYSRLASREWKPNSTILAKSNLELVGHADQRVSKVALLSQSGQQVPVELQADGLEFRVVKSDWQVEHSENYRLQFTTPIGLTTTSKHTIALDVIPDQPPTVRFIEPVEDLAVLPTTELPIVIEAEDELAVEQIDLVTRRSDRSETGEQRLTLWNAENNGEELTSARPQHVSYLLNLNSWSLSPGTQIELHAQAHDAQPMTGQTVRAIRLNVVSESELWNELLQQQSRIAEKLSRLLREQRELLLISTEWSEFPSWQPSRWAGSTHAVLYRQRQLTASLGTGQLSVASQLDDVLTAIQRNQLQRPQAVDRLQAVKRLINETISGPLVKIDDWLSEMTRATSSPIPRETLAVLITKTDQQQQVVATELKRALELLMPGNVLGRLERELTELENDQQSLLQLCETVIARDLQLTGEHANRAQEELDAAVRHQRELGRRLAELLLSISQAAERLADSDPALAVRLSETVELAGKRNTQSTMQSATGHLLKRRVGSATTAQRTTIEDLRKLRRQMTGSDPSDVAKRFTQLQATERELQRLRRKTAELQKQLGKLTSEQRRRELERLRREREQLAEQAEAMARQLERLRIPDAAQPARQASERLRSAELEREATQQARRKLDEAQRQLTTERRRQQVALARLQMAQLDAKLKAYAGQQRAILKEIRRLDGLRQQNTQLSTPQRESVRQLAVQQEDLRSEVSEQSEKLESLPIFAYLLQQAAKSMSEVAVRIRTDDLGPQTQSQAEAVILQLTQIIDSLRQERKDLEESEKQGGGGGEQQQGDTPQAQTLQLALGQLRLLKSLQTSLRDDTKAMEEAVASGKQPDFLPEELVMRQQELTALAEQLVPEPVDPPAEEPFPSLEDELENSLDDLLPQN